MKVFRGNLPSYSADEKVKAKDYLTVFTEKELEFVPERLAGGSGDEYMAAWNGNRVAMLDLDQGDLYNYEAGAGARWLDDSMLYGVAEGKLQVWDFDGTNRRELADGVTDYDVTISNNDKYLYYVVAGEKLTLTREQIIQ